MRRRLLNPGPVTLASSVRRALAESDDLCHREPRYAELEASVRSRLTALYVTDPEYSTTLLTGSGTAAVEAMVTSLVPAGGSLLVVANGVYGERMAAMAAAAGIDHTVVHSSLTDPIAFDEVAQRLDSEPAISHVAAVHHETTIGRLNDLGRLARVAGGPPLLVDAVSSFGAEEIRFDEWNVEAAAATANKCLHGVPGMAFVVARTAAVAERRRPASSVYLDLHAHHRAQRSGHPQFTPAVQSLVALDVALADLETSGGWRGRRDRYRSLGARVREGLAAAGVAAVLPPVESAASLTSFRLPGGVQFEDLFRELSDADFVIYPGQRDLYDQIFRLAVMGDLTDADVDEFVTVFTDITS